MQRKPNEVGVTIVGQNVDRFLLPRRLALPWHNQYVGLFLPRAPQLICCKKRRWSNDLVRCKSIQRKVTAVLRQNWPWAWPTHHGVKKEKNKPTKVSVRPEAYFSNPGSKLARVSYCLSCLSELLSTNNAERHPWRQALHEKCSGLDARSSTPMSKSWP